MTKERFLGKPKRGSDRTTAEVALMVHAGTRAPGVSHLFSVFLVRLIIFHEMSIPAPPVRRMNGEGWEQGVMIQAFTAT